MENSHYTKIPNALLEALALIRIPGEARQVLDVIIRQTYGYHRKSDIIALSQFRIKTGLKKQNVHRAIKKLHFMNIIVIKKDDSRGNEYSINKNFDLWKASSEKMTVINMDYTCHQKGLPEVIKYDEHKRKKETIKEISTLERYRHLV